MDEFVDEPKRIRLETESIEDVPKNKFDIQKYISNLQAEESDWKNTLNDQKHRYKKIKKLYALKPDQTLDLSVLNESEKSFLANKPDYDQFHKNVHKLQTMSTKVAFLKLHADKVHKNLYTTLQSEISEIAERIISLVD